MGAGLSSFVEEHFTQAPTGPITASIGLLSVFHPFPLRMDSNGTGSLIQYDACLQIGEFTTRNRQGDKLVIFIPLKASSNPGEDAKFISAFGNKIPSILGAQPDKALGYPDFPAATGSDWSIARVLKTDRTFYTWTNQDGTQVIVMSEPIFIAEPDLTNIQRLPITPPEDVIHEIGTVRYKSGSPIDSHGNPIPCSALTSSLPSIPVFQPPTTTADGKIVSGGCGGTTEIVKQSSFNGELLLQIVLGVIGTIAIVIGVWFGLKLASGPVGDMFRKLGDSLGKQLAGAYKSVKNVKVPPLPTPKFPSPAATKTPEQIADIAPTTIPEPKDFAVTNPGYKSKADFIAAHKTRRNPIRTPTQIADIAPTTLPEPSGDFAMTNPGYKNKSAFINAHKTRRNPIKPANKIADAPAPAASPASVIDSAGPSEFVPDADELLRRRRAERNRLAQPAGTGLFDLGNTPRPIDEIAQRKPRGPGKKVIKGPEESNTQRIAALARAHKKTPKRRNIGPIEEPDTPKLAATATLAKKLSDRAKKARESVQDFDKAVENTPKKATIFDSPATRANYGISEARSTEPQYLATAKTVPRKGGKKRRHRLKTGRQV